MKISIITPSYNQSSYLPICIRSVLFQTYKDIELIVIDGASTDGSVQILKTARSMDSRLRYISEPDTGQGNAVNKGFSIAKGEIIGWINSDDFYFDSNVFQYVVDFFENHPNIDILYGGMAYVDNENYLKHVRVAPDFDKELLKMISYIGNTNTFYRRSVIEKNKLEEDFHFVIDHDYMLTITKEYRAYRTDLIVACFRVHDQAKTQTLTESSKDKERGIRDLKHGITRNRIFKSKQFIARVKYKLSLIVSDLKYLRRMRSRPPYSIFLTDESSNS